MSVLIDSVSFKNEAERALYEERKALNQGRYRDNKAITLGLNDTLYNVHSDPELGPKALLEVAAHPTVTRNVYISKDGGGPLTGRNLDTAKVHIHFLPPRATRSLFAPDYRGRVKVTDNVDTYQQMLYRDFLREFGSKIGRNDVIHAITKSVSDQNAEALARWTQGLPEGGEALAMKWLQHRAVVDADGYIESNRAQWTPADAQNEVMKGLLSYELAYRRYIQLLLAESVKCKAQYADVPLNLISNKVTKAGKPTEQYDNFGIMDLIIEEYKKSKVESPGLSPLRVIYCVPPVLHVPMVERSLAECLALKKNLKYAGFIAGFELVGKADTLDQRLSTLQTVLENFNQECAVAKVSVPLLLSTGESH